MENNNSCDWWRFFCFWFRQKRPKFSNLFMHETAYYILIFIFASVISPSIFYISKIEEVKKFVKMEEMPLIAVGFGVYIVVACVIHNRLFSRRLKELKKINEIMSGSFQKILNLLIEKMNLIKAVKNTRQISGYLKELNEESFFKQLSIAMYFSLKEIFNDKLEIKIDIFRYEEKNKELKPIHNTYINGSFLSRKSSSFSVDADAISYKSLAEYTYIRNKIGYIINIPYTLKKHEKLSEEGKEKFRDKYRFYYQQTARPGGFKLGSLFCFPLIFNGSPYGILSVGFKEAKLENFIKSAGINLEDFKRNIELFVSDYTKFALNTSCGVENILQVFSKGKKQELAPQ